MRIAYLDCASGLSGDMILGALIDAGVSLDEIQRGIDSLDLPSCLLKKTEVRKKGFRAVQVTVEHEPEHVHRHLHHIETIVGRSHLTARQRELALAIFRRLAEAEARVHGTTIEKVHFHEVGAVDSIADIVGSAIGWDLLGVDRIECAPVPTGRGFIEIAHGRCSVPAPATAELLKEIPLADLAVEGELTTPTGAAIAAEMVAHFGPLPAMTIERIGYGAGQKDFPHANLLRLLVGETEPSGQVVVSPEVDSVVLLETNLDDATGESLGHCQHLLREAGALDVSTSPLAMKKGRPGVLLSVQCRPADWERMAQLMFSETTALGMRRSVVERLILPRHKQTVATSWGDVDGVVAHLPDGTQRFAPEYESCAAVAVAAGARLEEVQQAAREAYARRDGS
jgi:uncharacterized protein (TIGR00299 family) protein